MSSNTETRSQRGNAYNIFILVLTIFSLIVMVLLLLPLDQETLTLLTVYDNLICVIFLADFTVNLIRSKPKRDYFVTRRGWLDLIGSIPSFGVDVFRFTALFRLARLSRLSRIARLLRGENKKALIEDVVRNRGQYALFITVLLAIIVLTVASVLVLQFETRGDGNIQTGGDALWWGFVTITTVGYGDQFPVTGLGRLVGASVMFAGVGIIGALASILASLLVSPPPAAEEPESATESSTTPGPSADVMRELAAIREEVASLRQALLSGTTGDRPK